MLREVGNAVAVQLFKRLPWLAEHWARHHRFVEATAVPWARVTKPVKESVMSDPEGDPSFREMPSDVDPRRLTITHNYYDHAAADRDINVVLPLGRLRELADEGQVGAVAPRAYSFMGHIDGRHLRTLLEETAPAVADRLRADGAEAVFLTPA